MHTTVAPSPEDCLLVAVNRVHGEGGQTNGDVFGASIRGRGVLDPLASVSYYGLAWSYIHVAGLVLHS